MYSSGLPEKAGLDTIAVRRGKDPRATNSTSSTSAPCSDMLCRHQHLARPAGRGCTPPAASKGFGSQPAGKQKQQAGGAKQAAEQALADAARSRPRVRPINPREAARGKVDYVQVKDWADGKAADIGELQVADGGARGTVFSAAAGDSSSGPLYEQLARHAQHLESQGALRVALGPGAKPFRPFESWHYSMPRYRQYLAELAAVHAALEQAITTALGQQQPDAAAATTSSGSGSSSAGGAAAAAPAPGVRAALACFDASSGLWRAQAVHADLDALARLAAAAAAAAAAAGGQAPRAPGSDAARVAPSQNAVAYGRYLQQLGRQAAAAAASGGGGAGPSSSGYDDAEAAAAKLLAHAYAVHTQQQCLGSRIGAAASDELGLLAPDTRAAATYMQYPPHVAEPLAALVGATNAAGALLGAAGRQAVLDELPKALTKATLVLAPLATA